MSNELREKCEWKDGKFYPCNGFDPYPDDLDGLTDIEVYCKGCEALITKQALEGE